MKDFQKRVIIERNELYIKAKKLSDFIGSSPDFEGIDSEEQERLKEQCEVMWKYHEILQSRADAFQSLEGSMKNYIRNNVQPMRPYTPGEDMSEISISPGDQKLDTLEGGMIAVSVTNPDVKWYVSKKLFNDNYIEAN